MGIRIESAPSQPAVVYDRIHVLALMIEQSIYHDDSKDPVYEVQIDYRLYGVQDGQRYYHGPIHHVEVDDFIVLAREKAAAGDMTLANALPAIESAIAVILEHHGAVKVTEVV